MRRREFITLLGGAAVAWPLAARAQQGGLVRRVGWLAPQAVDDPQGQANVAVFQQTLRKLGWIAGRNLSISRTIGIDFNRAAAEAVSEAPDTIVVTGTPLTGALQKLTRTIPIVFVNVADPVASGYVASLARPGGNLTGFISSEYSIAGKWLNLLKEIAPNTSSVALLYNSENANWVGYLRAMEAAAPSLQMSVRAMLVTTAEEVARGVEAIATVPGASAAVQPTAFMIAHRSLLAELATRHRVPMMGPFGIFAREGGLISYGPDFNEPFRLAGTYVDRILRGEKPGDLPVQAPTKIELIINMKTAMAIGLTVSNTLLVAADAVIE